MLISVYIYTKTPQAIYIFVQQESVGLEVVFCMHIYLAIRLNMQNSTNTNSGLFRT